MNINCATLDFFGNCKYKGFFILELGGIGVFLSQT